MPGVGRETEIEREGEREREVQRGRGQRERERERCREGERDAQRGREVQRERERRRDRELERKRKRRRARERERERRRGARERESPLACPHSSLPRPIPSEDRDLLSLTANLSYTRRPLPPPFALSGHTMPTVLEAVGNILANWDFDLETFSRVPTDGSLTALACQLATVAKELNEVFLSC